MGFSERLEEASNLAVYCFTRFSKWKIIPVAELDLEPEPKMGAFMPRQENLFRGVFVRPKGLPTQSSIQACHQGTRMYFIALIV